MSKFAAWANSEQTPDLGIRLQRFDIIPGQRRQYVHFHYNYKPFDGHGYEASSIEPSGNFNLGNINDGSPDTAWSSVLQPPTSSDQWFQFKLPSRPSRHPAQQYNYLELTPRRVGGSQDGDKKICGFPEQIRIEIRDANLNWIHLRDVAFPPSDLPKAGPVIIHFVKPFATEGFRVFGTKLGVDDNGLTFFQMAGARAGLVTAEDLDRNLIGDSIKTLPPDSTFFFGDEPDLVISAKEYARVYDMFVDAIKRVHGHAKVTPAGFTSHHYAEEFFTATPAPTDEWRFNLFTASENAYNTDYFPLVKWANSHGGKPLVLGSFGMPHIPTEIDVSAALKAQMNAINADPLIVEAVYWSYNYNHSQHMLTTDDAGSSLTIDGRIFLQNS
ncbi:discoidin domain-containing protein [Gemmata sp.]|uniref:discoidin domain-containing protein n=1 Tax=Gemmata sp. TaxID=1914242 RepID=UPI003F700452